MKKIISIVLVLLNIIICSFLVSCNINSNNSSIESIIDISTSSKNENKYESKDLNNEKDEEIIMINVYCGNNVLEIELSNNASAKAFAEKLKEGDVVVTMNDYGNFEKVGSLGFSLVQSNEYITTSPGDVILYLGSNITIYYDENSWNFTLLGKIKNMNREKMLNFFGGKGEVVVRFSLN